MAYAPVEIPADTKRMCLPVLNGPVNRDRLRVRCDGLGQGAGDAQLRVAVQTAAGAIVGQGTITIPDGAPEAWRDVMLGGQVQIDPAHYLVVQAGGASRSARVWMQDPATPVVNIETNPRAATAATDGGWRALN
ncbi:MAG TPA: hypothetical protein VFR97_02315, partial [Capillimicrobium sp.]|nr:hypothetical protein [Capillimicrobium sp.]